MINRNYEWPMDEIRKFCDRWKITELSVFGSVLREDFRPDSDIDFLVSFQPGAGWSLLDHVQLEEELAEILGRDVDVITRRALERSQNWIRKNAILSTVEPLYATR